MGTTGLPLITKLKLGRVRIRSPAESLNNSL
jgi:hypothetical protein